MASLAREVVDAVDYAAVARALALVCAALPTSEAEWLVLHDAVHVIADGAPHPWVVLAHVSEALMACRPEPLA